MARTEYRKVISAGLRKCAITRNRLPRKKSKSNAALGQFCMSAFMRNKEKEASCQRYYLL